MGFFRFPWKRPCFFWRDEILALQFHPRILRLNSCRSLQKAVEPPAPKRTSKLKVDSNATQWGVRHVRYEELFKRMFFQIISPICIATVLYEIPSINFQFITVVGHVVFQIGSCWSRSQTFSIIGIVAERVSGFCYNRYHDLDDRVEKQKPASYFFSASFDFKWRINRRTNITSNFKRQYLSAYHVQDCFLKICQHGDIMSYVVQ